MGCRGKQIMWLNWMSQTNLLILTGWVTLSNQSGATYKNAKLQLVAGDVNRVQSDKYREAKRKFEMLAEEV